MYKKLTPDEQDQYMHFIEKFDATEQQKRDCIDTVWEYMQCVAEIVLGESSTQLLPENTRPRRAKKTKGESNT
jgi:hypothetical protein